jgi:hypothetical protein
MKLFWIVLYILLTVQSIFAERENIYGLRYDYLLHYETSLIISVSMNRWVKFEDYGIISVGSALLVGLCKEHFIDKDFDKRDIQFNILGAISGKLLSYTF